MSRLVDDIRRARSQDKLPKRFRAADVKQACPGWAYRTYKNFLPKHRAGNPCGYIAYFKQNSDGSYSLIE